MAVGGCDLGCREATAGIPPLEERGSSSCGHSHSEFSGLVEGGVPQGAHSGWVFVGSCRNPTSRTRARWKRHSLGLVLGSKTGGLELVLTGPLGAGTGGSGLAALQDGGVVEIPARNEEN